MTRSRSFAPRLQALLVLLTLLGAVASLPARGQMLEKRNRYTLQSGDQLEVKFRLTPDFNQTVTVQPDGFIQLNVAGDVRVTSLSVDEAEAAIKTSAEKRLNDPEVSISLLSFHKPFFVVAGEVAKPGRYDMSEDTTAMQALMMAGGPTADGKVSEIIVYRRINGNNGQVKILDLRNIKKPEDLERDCELQPGDMLYVTRNFISKLTQITRIGNNLGLYFNPLQAAF